MRNLDEQLREIQSRSVKLKKERRDRQVLAAGGLMTCVCLILITAVSLSLPHFSDAAAARDGRYGSLIITAPYVGYVIIGVLDFLLGICVTLLCVHLARRGKGSDRP